MISYCENCEQTKKDLNETKHKLVEFQNLAKKIVQTDLILRKYSDKERECEKLSGDLRKKDNDFDHLNDKYKNLLKEIETFKKQNKEYSKERAQLEQNLKQKDELIASFGQKESEFELKLNSYTQNERLLENKTNNYLKQIEDLKNELKILNEKHEKTVQQLNLGTVQETPSFALNNIRTSTQILNVNFKESSESSPAQLELPKRETTFFLGSESENEETDAKPALQKDISLSQDGSESMNISLSEKPEISNQPQDSREIKFSHAKEESNAKSLAKQILDITSSLESSGSESDSDSESSICSSSVASSHVSEKSKSVFNTKDLFGSELSDEENDNQKDKSVDITNIQEEFAQSQQKDAEEAEILENRIEHLTDQYMDYMQQKTIDELIEVSIEEQLILELFFDQFLNEETSSKSYLAANILENVCTVCIEEERDERKQMEKKLRDEIRIKLEEEISEKIFDEKINQLMLECSQRVLAEAKNEQVDLMYKSIVDQVCKENIEKCLMELLFDDMLSVPKPMIEKLEFKIQKETEYRSNKRRFPVDFSLMEEKGKRSRKESGGSESSWKSSLAFVEDTDKKTLEEFVKECLADYFRKFNFKIEFTFEELDQLIDKLARAVKKKSLQSNNSKFVAHILIKHYLNNKFIPLDELKLNQVDENELKLFKQINMICNTPVKDEFESITRTIYGKRSSQSSYTSYLQSRLNDAMMAKITKEEEKYVYILRKLTEYPTLEAVQLEFLNCLKVLVLSNEFQNTFKMKMGRMLCFLCKSSKNYDYLKCFMCDLITSRETSMPMHFQNLILWFARIWPECLTWPCSIDQVNDEDIDSAELKNPILFVVMGIVKSNIFKNNVELEKIKPDFKYSKFSKYYVHILESLCNWSIESTKSLDSLSFLKASIQHAFESTNYFNLDEKIFSLNGLMLEYCEAFKLLCLNEDWTWTKQNFIDKFISKEMNNLDDKLMDNSLQTDDIFKYRNKYGFLLISMSSIVSLMCPVDNYALEILSQIEIKFNSLNTVYINYELALVESVILLSRFDPTKCLNMLQQWNEKFKIRSCSQNVPTQLPESLKLEIQTIQSIYKEKIDENVQILSF